MKPFNRKSVTLSPAKPEAPQKKAAPAKKAQDGPSYHDQIHGMITKGHSLQDIHKAIDAHPDMHSKEHFKEWAALVHPRLAGKGQPPKQSNAKENA